MKTLTLPLATACALTALLPLARVTFADVIINDRSGDPPGAMQHTPSVCLVHRFISGDYLLAVWNEEVTFASGLPRFNYAVSPAQPPLQFTDLGPPPAPAGYAWYNNPIVRAPDFDLEGTFYLLGQVRAAPRMYGVGFVRGQVTSPNTVLWDTPQVILAFNNSSVSAYMYDNIGMEIDHDLGTIHVLCGNLNPSVPDNALRHMSSSDGGTTWTSPAWIGVDSTMTGFPLLQCGLFSDELYVLWSAYTGGTFMTSRGIRSTNGGASFGPPFDLMQVPNRYQGGPGEASGTEPQISSTIDRIGGPYGGRLVFGSTNVMDLSTDVFTDLSTAPRVVEAEPNGTAAAANLVASNSSVIRGTLPISTPADTDYFRIGLSAGEPIDASMDSTGNGIYITLGWLATDGKTVLAESYNSFPLAFRAPVAGNYYLRAYGAPPVNSGYRLRLTTPTAPLPGARDQRDVMLALRDPPGTSTAGFVLTTPPSGYEETGVSLTWNLDGYLYASWTEFAVTAGKAISRRVLSRSGDGGVTWEAAIPLSSATTDWMQVPAAYPGMGFRSEALSDGHTMLFSWTDGRNGDPDVFFADIYRNCYSSDPYSNSRSAHPGEVVSLSRILTNQDTVYPFGLQIVGSSLYRNWPFPSGSGSLAAGGTASLAYSFTVPDTAAQGDFPVFVDYRSDRAPFVYTSAVIHLTVLAAVDVTPRVPARLALERVAPNPAHAPASIVYSLSRAGRVRLSVIGIDGRRVRALVDGDAEAGSHTRAWDGTNERGQAVAPGAYFLRMEAENRVLTQRFVWLR